MYIERLLRGIAGTFIIISLLLSVYHHQKWLWFTGFIGLNLLQSSITDKCPMINILQMAGFKRLKDK